MEHFTLLLVIVVVSLTPVVFANHERKPEPYLPGTTILPGQFPHLVSFKYENEATPVCGGAILGSRYILTSALCLNRNKTFEVIVGCVDFTSLYCIPFQVEKMIKHPNYTGIDYINNIGIVVLTEDISYNTFAKRIPLSSMEVVPGTSLNMTGMDREELNMKWMNVISETDSNCNSTHPEWESTIIFCTGPDALAVNGAYGYPVEFIGHLVGISLYYNTYNLVLRIEPYMGFIYSIIQGNTSV